MITLLGVLVLGVVLGKLCVRSDEMVVDRYVAVDDRHFSRWRAYCRLLGSDPRVAHRGDGCRIVSDTTGARAARQETHRLAPPALRAEVAIWTGETHDEAEEMGRTSV